MVLSIIVYTFLMGVMILLAIYTSQKDSYLRSLMLFEQSSFWRFEILFPLLIFALIFGMRYDVGVDHLGYLDGYLLKEHVSKSELLFELITEISWFLNFHYVVYFSIFALIQVFFFFYAFKNEKYLYPLLVFFLFTNNEWTFWMNGIRQALAMCIWIFSLKYIEQKKFWKYLFWVIVALLFHKSAIILIIFYPILSKEKYFFNNIPQQFFLIILAFVFKTLFSDMILRFEPIITSYANILGGESYEVYDIEMLMDSFSDREGTGLAYLFKLLLNIVIIFYSKKLKLFYNNNHFNLLYFFFVIGIITFYMFPIGAISITRPFRYFYIFQSIMYAYFLNYLSETKLKSTPSGMTHAFLFYGMIFIFLGIFYLFLITSNDETSTWYQFFFNQNIYGYPN